jgi:hypothetical protein
MTWYRFRASGIEFYANIDKVLSPTLMDFEIPATFFDLGTSLKP